jgi:hemolysin activation/secretion protein
MPQSAVGEASVPEGADALEVDLQGVSLEGAFPEELVPIGKRLDTFGGRRVRVGDIYRLATELQTKYIASGFPFVRVIVPPQDLADGGIVRLTLIDGFIEALVLDGLDPALRHAAERLLRPLVGVRQLSFKALERQISLLGDVPGGTVRTAIARGDAIGGVKLIVDGKIDRWSGSIAFDNRTSAAFNHRQVILSVVANGLLGRGESFYVYAGGDPLAGSPLAATATRRLFGSGATFPLGSRGAVLGLEYTNSRTQPLGGPFITRDLFQKVSASLTQSLMRTRRQNLTFRGAIEYYRERQTAPEFDALLFFDEYAIGRVRFDYSHGSEKLNFGGAVIVSHGRTSIDPNISSPGATPRFTKSELSAFASWRLPVAGLVGSANLQSQLIFDGVLPIAESFLLDGPSGLSTFDAGGASASEGVVLRTVLSRPIAWTKASWTIVPNLFGAVGFARHQNREPFLLTRAASYGLGLQFVPIKPFGGISPVVGIEYGWRTANRDYARGQRLTVDVRLGF